MLRVFVSLNGSTMPVEDDVLNGKKVAITPPAEFPDASVIDDAMHVRRCRKTTLGHTRTYIQELLLCPLLRAATVFIEMCVTPVLYDIRLWHHRSKTTAKPPKMLLS